MFFPAWAFPDGNYLGQEHPGVGGAKNVCVFVHDTIGTHDSSAGGNGGDVVQGIPATSGTADPLPSAPNPIGSPAQDGNPGGFGGDPGAYGNPRAAGFAASTLGAFDISSTWPKWTPTSGGGGETGTPGQGGGGCDGNNYMGADQPGGGGGSGGCGGSGGGGGTGGGASIALLAFDNLSISLSGCTIITGGGGTGGLGGPGQDGQAPGNGGYGVQGAGGNGGSGAGGSGGAGGTGGISAGIVYHVGSAPVVQSDCTFIVGDPGHGGAGGTPGSDGERWAGLQGAAGFDEYQAYGANLASMKSVLQQ